MSGKFPKTFAHNEPGTILRSKEGHGYGNQSCLDSFHKKALKTKIASVHNYKAKLTKFLNELQKYATPK